MWKWLFVDRAALDETTEVSLLASVGNKYALRELQQAAIVLDRSMRKPWEKGGRNDSGGNRRFNSVHFAADGPVDEDNSDEDGLLEDKIVLIHDREGQVKGSEATGTRTRSVPTTCPAATSPRRTRSTS